MKSLTPMRTPGRATVAAMLGLAALLCAGCATFSYDQLKLGQEVRDRGRVFSDDRGLQTALGLAYVNRDEFGRTDAFVVLLTPDQRVAGKLHAAAFERHWGWKREYTYRLTGTVDRNLLDLGEVGPIDSVRVLLEELTDTGRDLFARETHGWIAAGLVRVLEYGPRIDDVGPVRALLTDELQRVPANGTARLEERGSVLELEYTRVERR